MTFRSLCVELHKLFRVMWSGKWKVVTPHALLAALWKFAPSFRNYEQQDAGEFLCYLLDRMKMELEEAHSKLHKGGFKAATIVESVFAGTLKSVVTCHGCNRKSTTGQDFMSTFHRLLHRMPQLTWQVLLWTFLLCTWLAQSALVASRHVQLKV